MAGKTKTVTHVRDTRNGQYVKPSEAAKRPATTVKETDRVKKK